MDRVLKKREIIPLSLKEANQFIIKHHRHHWKVQGHKFSIGLKEGDKLIGVAICGRPVSRHLDDGYTLEVLRVCVLEGYKNACSQLYSACARIAKEMGYKKIITYILKSEPGTSLKAAGWQKEDEVKGKSWDCQARHRELYVVDLFGQKQKYPLEDKQRWAKILKK